MNLARQLATKHEIQYIELKEQHKLVDYSLACVDGRLKVIKTGAKRETLRKTEKTPKEIARTAISMMDEVARMELLEDLLK